MYLLQFDGLFRDLSEYGGNSLQAGFMSYGWLIYKNEQTVARGLGVVARGKYANSNIAEYIALIEGLDALLAMGVHHEPIEVRGDAKSVINQMEGLARVSSAPTRILHQRAMGLSLHFRQLCWCWVPRCNNRAADSLTRQAIRRMHSGEHYHKIIDTLKGESTKFLPVIDLRVFQFSQ
jgi:ribonuclease HI